MHPSSTTNEKYGLLPSHTKVGNITIQGPRSVVLGRLPRMQKVVYLSELYRQMSYQQLKHLLETTHITSLSLSHCIMPVTYIVLYKIRTYLASVVLLLNLDNRYIAQLFNSREFIPPPLSSTHTTCLPAESSNI